MNFKIIAQEEITTTRNLPFNISKDIPIIVQSSSLKMYIKIDFDDLTVLVDKYPEEIVAEIFKYADRIKKLPSDLNILYAEDHSVLAKYFMQNIGRIHQITKILHAENPIELIALAKEQNFSPDIIITDVNMPEKKGDEWVREIRNGDYSL